MKNENENKKQEVMLNGVKISREQFEMLKGEFEKEEKEVWKPYDEEGHIIQANGEAMPGGVGNKRTALFGENFKTKELAEAVSKSRQLHNYLWQLKFDFDWGFVPDFEETATENWNILFHHISNKFTMDWWGETEVVGVPIFSKEGAELIVDKLNNKEIILPGFEVVDE